MNKANRTNTANSGTKSAEDQALELFGDMIIKKLETIQKDWHQPWFTEWGMSWPRNLSGREYNGMNALMLQLLCEQKDYKVPVFCTFERVAGLNYIKQQDGTRKPAVDQNGEKQPLVSINKGEKSFPVFITTYTVVDKETKERIKFDDYKRLSDEEREKYNVYPKLQVYRVFNIDQTNLKEARPELYTKLEEQFTPKKDESVGVGKNYSFPALDAMVKDNGWICPIKPTYGNDAYYSISKDLIVIPQKEQFNVGESYYNTMAHEMMHSTGAEHQLNRIKTGQPFASNAYATEELVAELGAALVMSRYGVQRTIKDDSLPYLKSWLGSLNESPSYIKNVLMDVKRGAAMLTQRIDAVNERIEQGLEPIPKQELLGQREMSPDAHSVERVASRALPKELSDEEVMTRLDNFMQQFYFNARRENGARVAGYTEYDGQPALRMTIDSSIGTSHYVISHELDNENKDRFFMHLMDEGKELTKAKEMPQDKTMAMDFIRDAVRSQSDYEYEKRMGQQENQEETVRRGRSM